jgi:hypothetical protein
VGHSRRHARSHDALERQAIAPVSTNIFFDLPGELALGHPRLDLAQDELKSPIGQLDGALDRFDFRVVFDGAQGLDKPCDGDELGLLHSIAQLMEEPGAGRGPVDREVLEFEAIDSRCYPRHSALQLENFIAGDDLLGAGDVARVRQKDLAVFGDDEHAE